MANWQEVSGEEEEDEDEQEEEDEEEEELTWDRIDGLHAEKTKEGL